MKPSGAPSCYGDPRHYDTHDPECRSCHVRVRCGIKAKKAEQRGSKKSEELVQIRGTRGSNREVARAREVIDDDEEIPNPIARVNTKGWFGALFHNAWVRCTSLFLREAAYGVDQIALEPYPGEPPEKDDR